jgi:cell division protein FtsQ
VAFVRQGAEIGLVDANGVLFDMPGPEFEAGMTSTAHTSAQYSFPVLTGIAAADPLSTRSARMRIYSNFMTALDATGEGISHQVSEVDVSNPEDVKAIIPDAGATGPNILVHFGEEKFLERYHQYKEHLPEWRTQYPKLGSVDMRYERQVVLEMQPGAAVPSGDSAPAATATAPPAPAKKSAVVPKKSVVAAKRAGIAKKQAVLKWKPKGKPVGAASQGAAR